MAWRDHPSIKATGDIAMPARADHYANPPSNLGLHGLQIGKTPYQRTGYSRDGVVGVATRETRPFVRKGQPMRGR